MVGCARPLPIVAEDFCMSQLDSVYLRNEDLIKRYKQEYICLYTYTPPIDPGAGGYIQSDQGQRTNTLQESGLIRDKPFHTKIYIELWCSVPHSFHG